MGAIVKVDNAKQASGGGGKGNCHLKFYDKRRVKGFWESPGIMRTMNHCSQGFIFKLFWYVSQTSIVYIWITRLLGKHKIHENYMQRILLMVCVLDLVDLQLNQWKHTFWLNMTSCPFPASDLETAISLRQVFKLLGKSYIKMYYWKKCVIEFLVSHHWNPALTWSCFPYNHRVTWASTIHVTETPPSLCLDTSWGDSGALPQEPLLPQVYPYSVRLSESSLGQ